MTLSSLLNSVPFDSMIPSLEKLSLKQTNHNQIGYYKMAYDELSHIRPKYEGYSMRIVMRNYNNKSYLTALDIEGVSWSKCLGYELDIADNVTASDSEIAAQCLWGLTFYSFSRSRKSIYRRNGMTPPMKQLITDSGIKWDEQCEIFQKSHKLIADEISSRYCGHQNRIDYVADIAEKYMAVNFSTAEKLNINVYVSELFPLTDTEKERLNLCARTVLPNKDCNFSINTIPQQRQTKFVKVVIWTFQNKQTTDNEVLDKLKSKQ